MATGRAPARGRSPLAPPTWPEPLRYERGRVRGASLRLRWHRARRAPGEAVGIVAAPGDGAVVPRLPGRISGSGRCRGRSRRARRSHRRDDGLAGVHVLVPRLWCFGRELLALGLDARHRRGGRPAARHGRGRRAVARGLRHRGRPEPRCGGRDGRAGARRCDPRRAGRVRRVGVAHPAAAAAQQGRRRDPRRLLSPRPRILGPRSSGRSDRWTTPRRLAALPMLVVHGSEDESVPVFDARVLADAHGTAELRIIAGAGHGLRYDPRGSRCCSGGSTASNRRA